MTTEMIEAPTNGALHRSASAATQTALTREASEVQAAMLVAQRCPRDEIEAERRIIQACKRPGLAEQAMYAYPRGGTTVTGPSIRLAEALARNWGNMSCGIKELAQHDGESDVMAYAWDMETNFREEKVFTIKHERHKKNGQVDKLTDPRDIYELVANQGARRLRACILAIIPGDIVERAIEECEKTLKGKNDKPLVDRIKAAIERFADIGVTKAQLEKRIGHKIETMLEVELLQLVKVYRTIVDGAGKKEDFFPPEAGAKQTEEAAAMQKEILAEGEVPNDPPSPASAGADELADNLIEKIDQATRTTQLDGIRGEWVRSKAALGTELADKVKAAWDEKYKALKAAK